jgi:hypothetical protein
MAGPAAAADNGTGDPLGLIASAAIQPFHSAGPDFTLIEVTSPLDWNDLHVIYFDSTCKRLISKFKFISYKGAIMFSPDLDGAAAQVTGLAVIASNKNNLSGSPIYDWEAIHVRGHWLNFAADWVRIVDPIAVNSPETGRRGSGDRQHYSALRSAASFGAPINAGPFSTFIYLNCPGPTIIGPDGVLSPSRGFGVGPKVAYAPTRPGLVFGNLYDGQEQPLVNFDLACNCSTMYELNEITPTYGSAAALGPELVSYTELYTYRPPLFSDPPKEAFDPNTFTGYRAIRITNPIWPDGNADDFGRLANGSAYNYRVNGADPVLFVVGPDFPFPPFFVPGLR